MIEFLCPNEHKIRCPDDKAGRQAKCPKCGVSFRIPTLEELTLGQSSLLSDGAAAEVTDMAAGGSSPGGSGRQAAATAAPPAAAASSKQPQIEFLCPNGHHLHGPASLQGRAGECPECGSRFRIPVVDEPQEGAETPADAHVPELSALGAEEEIRLEFPPAASVALSPEGAPLEFAEVLDLPGSGVAAAGAAPAFLGAIPAAAVTHPLASLFAEYWAARDDGSRVEVHLESGSVLLPDGYVKSHSLHDYAVLVTKDPDGASTVTVVPWNSISRIILRALKRVPGEVVK